MSHAIVWSSKTGNTARLAKAIEEVAGEDCVYAGAPSKEALSADRLYVGFWTDKGTCDAAVADILAQAAGREVFLFGTAGFGGSSEYFDQIISRVAALLPSDATLVGTFMCQGKMGIGVRRRYEAMREDGAPSEKVDAMIANFDAALTHPDAADIAALQQKVRSAL